MNRTSPEALRGVIVGLGAMGSRHLRVVTALPDAEVVAVVDPSAERRANAMRSGTTAHSTLREALT